MILKSIRDSNYLKVHHCLRSKHLNSENTIGAFSESLEIVFFIDTQRSLQGITGIDSNIYP